jgi:hypothetical protein
MKLKQKVTKCRLYFNDISIIGPRTIYSYVSAFFYYCKQGSSFYFHLIISKVNLIGYFKLHAMYLHATNSNSSQLKFKSIDKIEDD